MGDNTARAEIAFLICAALLLAIIWNIDALIR